MPLWEDSESDDWSPGDIVTNAAIALLDGVLETEHERITDQRGLRQLILDTKEARRLLNQHAYLATRSIPLRRAFARARNALESLPRVVVKEVQRQKWARRLTHLKGPGHPRSRASMIGLGIIPTLDVMPAPRREYFAAEMATALFPEEDADKVRKRLRAMRQFAPGAATARETAKRLRADQAKAGVLIPG